ncbi:MAG: T9SS type A sorting domain-containing protein [Candidatus Marinimicrobia bacterium]|nr:T9SS type A sorting domain-containing protein [Candidatus Neomarinimicrobiota bacterium]
MKKMIIACLVTVLSISNIYAGWSETFETAAEPSAALTLQSDMTWNWWGWGVASVADGYITLVGALDPFENNTSWLQIDQSIDANAEVTPSAAEIYVKVRFMTEGTPSTGDQFHVCVKVDPAFLTNLAVHTVVSAPGQIGDFWFQTNESNGVPSAAVAYDTWHWQKIVVDGNSVSVTAWADGEAMPDTATYSYEALTTTEAPTFILVGVTDDDSSSVQVGGVWYNETPAGLEISDEAPIATRFELGQNYPNPFNPTTHIRFNIPETANTKLTVFNVMGEEVATLVNSVMQAGGHTVSWNASSMPTGVYFYQLESANFSQTKKLLLVK